MPTFPSVEWMDQFCAELAHHSRVGEVAPKLQGIYRFEVDPAGPLRDRHRYDVRIASDAGVVDVRRVEGEGEPRVSMRADYERWRQLLEGRLEIRSAVLFGHLRISGDLATLMRSAADLAVVTEALTSVETQWLG